MISFSKTLKQHYVAISLYVLYLVCWIWLGYVAHYEFTHYGDGEEIGMCLYFFIPFLCLPYIITVSLFIEFKKDKRAFYKKLFWLIIIPIPIAVLYGLLIHFMY